MFKFINFVLFCLVGGLILWAGGTWWQMLLGQLLAMALNLIGWIEGRES